jgi:CDP-diacylglycerol--glycerol-3-phosphate 3-phosphatidyltransferase/cardiolipin synthase
MRQQGLLNAPNVVSLSRLVLAACFIAIGNTHVRLVLLITAALTDALDGWLARRRNYFSRSGALIDAIADRVFVLSAVCALYADNALSLGQTLVFLSRDIATAIGFVVARIIPWLRRAVFKARFGGKAVTVLQFLTLAAALEMPQLLPLCLTGVAVASIAAIVDYTWALWRGRAVA